MFNYNKVLSEEDKLALKLRKEFKDYETRVSLAMIPLYKARHEHIVNEIKFKTQNGAPVNDIEFLKNTEKDV